MPAPAMAVRSDVEVWATTALHFRFTETLASRVSVDNGNIYANFFHK
jgi:hypothetical protein